MENPTKTIKYVEEVCDKCHHKFIQKVKSRCYQCYIIETHQSLFPSAAAVSLSSKDVARSQVESE